MTGKYDVQYDNLYKAERERDEKRLRELRGKRCTYGEIDFYDCPYVQVQLQKMSQKEEE